MGSEVGYENYHVVNQADGCQSRVLDGDDGETKSLTESVTDYPVMWGRSYHKYKEGSYVLPNDDKECDRLALQHDVLKWLRDDKLYFAPLQDPKQILDIGTGIGDWVIEMASLFPNAHVIGTDLSPIQPSLVPPNVSFEIQDCTDSDWFRKPASHDLIHASMLVGSLPSHSKLMQTARRYLKPGKGWLECHEIEFNVSCDDGTIPPAWPLHEWFKGHREGYSNFRSPRTLTVSDRLARLMQEAGFVDIQERVDKIPINPWPKDPFLKGVGQMWETNWLEGLAGFSNKLYGPDGLGWSQNELEVFLVDVRKCIRDRNVHAYQKFHVVYGRRPTEDEEKTLKKSVKIPGAKLGDAVKPEASRSASGQGKTNMGPPPSPKGKEKFTL